MAVTLRQVERISGTLSGTTLTITLSTTLLDVDKAFLVFGVQDDGVQPQFSQVRGYISSTTQVVFDRNYNTSGSPEIIGYVVEFTAGVTVDHFQGSVEADGNMDLTLSNVTDLSKAWHTKGIKASGSDFGRDDAFASYLWNDSGTLKCNIDCNDTSISGVSYAVQVIQYDDCSVQRGSLTTIGSGTSGTATLTAVDTDQSFLLFNWRADNTTYVPDDEGLRGRITSTTQATFDRNGAGISISDLRWEVVEFTDSVTVQTVSESFAASDGQEDATITAVSGTDKAIAFASCQQFSGQTGGLGAYSTTDLFGEVWFTADLTSTTNLQTKRGSTNSTANVEFYVVDFGASASGTTYNQSVAGSMPAAAGALTYTTTFGQSVAGDMPAAQGALIKKISKSIAGSLPAPVGDMLRMTSTSVAGDMPAADGALTKKTSRSTSGSMPAPSGSVAGVITNLSQVLLGNMPAAAGGLIKKVIKALSGDMPAPGGDIVEKKVSTGVSGDMPAPSGSTDTTWATTASASGDMPAPSGSMSTILNPIVVARKLLKIIGSSFKQLLG